MPRKKEKPDVRIAEMKERFLNRSGELWDIHIDKAMQILDEGETRVVTLNFKAILDFTESTAKEKTRISYSQAFTDERQDDFEDPRQGQLMAQGEGGEVVPAVTPGVDPDADPDPSGGGGDGDGDGEQAGGGKKKGRRKKKKDSE